MDITITVSDKFAQKVQSFAKESGRPVGELLEEAWEEHFVDEDKTDDENYQNPLSPFIGMFSSGYTDTAERHSEILREAVNMPGGFSND